MTEHTPGPWAWQPTADDPLTHAELLPSGYLIGETDSILHHGANWPMKLPDMRLIAAAPDMLSALDRMLKATYTVTTDEPSAKLLIMARKEARAAIVKARNQ